MFFRSTTHRFTLAVTLTVTISIAGTSFAADPSAAINPATAAGSGVWVTSVAHVQGDQFVAATADGLLLRESSVCSFSGKAPETLQPLYSHPAGVWAVATTHDGKQVVSSDYRGNLAVHTIGGETKMHEGLLERWSQALAVAPDGAAVVAGNEAGKLFAVDIAAGSVAKSLELGGSAVAAIAFSPDGKKLAASDGSGTVHLVSWPALEATGKIKVSEEAAWGVAFIDDETFVVGSSDRNLYRCAAITDAKPESILAGRDWITQVSINGNGQIAAAELGGIVHVVAGRGGGSQLTAPSSVWAVCWNGVSELFVGTRKNGVVTATQAWKLAEPKPEPKPEVKPEPQAEPENKADEKPEAKPEAKPEPEAKKEPAEKTEAAVESKSEAKPEANSEPKKDE